MSEISDGAERGRMVMATWGGHLLNLLADLDAMLLEDGCPNGIKELAVYGHQITEQRMIRDGRKVTA